MSTATGSAFCGSSFRHSRSSAPCDPHANLSPAMIAATDALIAYRTNPHVDQRDRGLEAAWLMTQTLAGEIRPTQDAASPGLVINIECQDPTAFPCLPHYEAAARRLAVGGHAPEWAGDAESQPIDAEWRVTAVSDGRFTETKPRHGGGTAFDQGPTAVLAHDSGITVMVTSRRMAPFSLEQIRHTGLDPAAFRLLVAKGVHAPVAAYGEICREFIRVNTPGVTTADLSRLNYRRSGASPLQF